MSEKSKYQVDIVEAKITHRNRNEKRRRKNTPNSKSEMKRVKFTIRMQLYTFTRKNVAGEWLKNIILCTLSIFQTIPLLCTISNQNTYVQLEGITTFNNMYFVINDCLLFLLLCSNLRDSNLMQHIGNGYRYTLCYSHGFSYDFSIAFSMPGEQLFHGL